MSQYIFFNVFQSKIQKAPPSAMLKDVFLTAAPLDNKRLHPAQPHYINYDICGKYVQTKANVLSVDKCFSKQFLEAI